MEKFIVKGEENTYKIACILAKYLSGGDIILLNGDLGAGKTTLVKQIGKALGITKTITSPTFTLLKTYATDNFTLVHVDAYRLENESFDELDDYLNDENVIFIEWASNLENQEILKDSLTVKIEYVNEDTRSFEFISHSSKYDSLEGDIKNV